jgi:hypothetical protein
VFVLALVTTPAGVSGVVPLLPTQLSVLHFPSPGVTPTNLLFNMLAVPDGLMRFRQDRRLVSPLTDCWSLSVVVGIVGGIYGIGGGSLLAPVLLLAGFSA